MARPVPSGKDGGRGGEWRDEAGLRPLSLLVLDLIRPALDRQGRLLLQLKAAWPVIAGEREARFSSPRRLQQGVLTLAVSPALALELQHRTGELTGRINAHLGTTAVSRIRLLQDPSFTLPPSSSSPPPPPSPSPSPPPPPPGSLFSLPPGEVREALVRLARALYHGGT